MTELEYYLKRFSEILPKILELPDVEGAEKITHGWHQVGLYGEFWDQGETPRRPKKGFVMEKTPQFRLRTKSYALEGSLDSDAGEAYWVFTLKMFNPSPLHTRKGLRGPYSLTTVEDILEEDLPKIPEFLTTLSPKPKHRKSNPEDPKHDPNHDPL